VWVPNRFRQAFDLNHADARWHSLTGFSAGFLSRLKPMGIRAKDVGALDARTRREISAILKVDIRPRSGHAPSPLSATRSTGVCIGGDMM